ncbi:hypothetical protein BD626DRAFT_485742 [Schizophyllum amplum]|uniref:F-box domain-containing protein n=1 Tax=Schizophyllum amplum TaxID=97359 RepID=A0A550CLS0_9AGAR|nr:hypothetical protein BD626DRAFT_485742 [Auriculariopsis ampla]
MTEDHQNLSVTLCRECSRSYKVPQQALPAPSARDDLRRRRLPSETEAQAIQLAILDTYQHLASIEEEVMKILAQAEAMEELKKILQRSIETRQALVAPVRRLPVELLSEVFDLVCDDDGEYMCDKLPMPLVLSSVSKVWRGACHIGLSARTLIAYMLRRRHDQLVEDMGESTRPLHITGLIVWFPSIPAWHIRREYLEACRHPSTATPFVRHRKRDSRSYCDIRPTLSWRSMAGLVSDGHGVLQLVVLTANSGGRVL